MRIKTGMMENLANFDVCSDNSKNICRRGCSKHAPCCNCTGYCGSQFYKCILQLTSTVCDCLERPSRRSLLLCLTPCRHYAPTPTLHLCPKKVTHMCKPRRKSRAQEKCRKRPCRISTDNEILHLINQLYYSIWQSAICC